MPQTKEAMTSNDHKRIRKNKKIRAKADEVRLDLDKYHKELGGLFNKKVTFYCMPRQTGKTKKAIKKLKECGDPKKAQFITIIDEGEKVTYGEVIHKDRDVVIKDDSSFIIIDDVHFLSLKKITKLLNDFRQSILATELVCFGTNADVDGKPIRGARHLENMADQVVYDTSPCQSCMSFGRTCFTKILFEKHVPYETDCRLPDSDDEEDGYYYERDLCFDCRNFRG